VCAATRSAEVDVIGHSMGGVVGRYYVTFAGGDGVVKNLITLGSPHAGTDVSSFGIGHPTRELVLGSKLVARLAAEHFASLKAAPLRIAALDLPVPFAPELEAVYRPNKDKIVEAITAWLG